jgi:membrane-bound serine protease (ClpP class)
MTFPERFLHVILDPNFAFILLSIGSIGIIAELYNPGALFPGITGVISLILAFFALGNLPTNWAGVGLIVLALILFIAELNTETTGVLAVGGIIAFLLGALILFRPFQPGSPALPDVQVSPWLIAVTTTGMAAFTLLVIRQVLRTRKAPLLTGYEQFVGQIVPVRRDLRPKGRVWFQGQMWFARTQSGQEVETGKEVRIVGLDDLTLVVEPLDEEITPGSGT